MIEIVCALIAAAASVLAASAEVRSRRLSGPDGARAERRSHEMRLSMELMYAPAPCP